MLGERISKFFNRERAGESVKEVRFKSGAVVRFTENNGEFSLELKKDGATVNLLDFAPPGTQLVRAGKTSRTGRWGAMLDYRRTGRPAISFEEFRSVADLLNFLHEAGHLHDAGRIRAVNAAKGAHMRAADYNQENYSPERMRAMAAEWREVRDSEYAAWEYALRTANDLNEKYGLKIFDELGNAEGTQKLIRSCLKTYEAGYVGGLSEANIKDADEMERYFTGLLTGGEAGKTDEKQKN